MIIKEVLTADVGITWLPWAVQYFFLIGLAFAAVWIATTAVFTKGCSSTRVLKLCAIVMISTSIVAVISLAADLHQPARAFNFYSQLRPSSWMWFGALLLPIFCTLSILFSWLLLRDDFQQRSEGNGWIARLCRLLTLGHWDAIFLIKPIAIIASLSAGSIAIYTSMEVMVIEARPLWNTAWLPLILISSAIFSCAGVLILLNRSIQGANQQCESHLTQWCRLSIWIFVLFIAGWLLTNTASTAEAIRLFQFSPIWQLAMFWVVGTLLLLAFLLRGAKPISSLTAIFSALLALHLSWGLRWILLIEGQTIPKYGAGTYFYQLPLGPEGLLGIAGTFGLWFAIVIIISELIRTKHSFKGVS